MGQRILHKSQAGNGALAANRVDYETAVKAAAIFVVMFVVYLLTRSAGLDEFDSVNFAMGVRAFNLWNNQPHPPGYPLFIFFGWIGTRGLGLSPQTSLHLVSCVGGALFIAAWFLIIRSQLNERLAWWIAACLSVMPAVWLTATKIMTDSLAAGFLSLEIFAAICFWQRRSVAALLGASLCGAAASGARPQLILIVIVILIAALKMGHARWKISILAVGVLIASCLVWLLPMWYLQARLRPDVPAWLVYPKLVYGQWQWRLDKPHTFIGAGNWSAHYLATRFAEHFLLGWFGLGFGFLQSPVTLAIGIAMIVGGFAAYILGPRDLQDRLFWKFHAPWALIYIAIIFVCLGGTARYYILIFPLLLVAILRGFLQMRTPWNWTALALPILLLYIAIPNVIQNHREQPPSARMVHYLMQLYPPSQRKNVALLFLHAVPHAEWYAPEFKTFRDVPPPGDLPQALENSVAVYTDDAHLPLPAGWQRVPLAEFDRSVIVHSKHHFLQLFLIQRHS